MSAIVSDASLVTAAAAGDQRAFRTLYREYARPVYWVAHALVGASDAEDVTQETFVTAWKKMPELTLENDSLLPWLVTICRYQSSNRVRKQIRDREHAGAALGEHLAAKTDVEQQVITEALAKKIADECARLGETDRAVFTLCAVDGYSYEQAADALGISHGSVRNRLSRVRSYLRDSLDDTRSAESA